MKFADFVCAESIQAQIAAETKEEVILELVGALVDSGSVELGSTGIGRGIAVPHTKHPSVDRLVATVGVSASGVEFNSLDDAKVQIFFLLVSPPDRPGDHLRALENVARQLRDSTFCRFLKQSTTPEEIWQLLDEADSGQFGS
jgi:PTS system nitrogen regulatory IIA component